MSSATALEHAISRVSHRAQKLAPYDAANRYLEGPFAPVHAER